MSEDPTHLHVASAAEFILEPSSLQLERRVMLVPTEMPQGRLRGIGAKQFMPGTELWIVLAPKSAQPLTLARILAALLIDGEEHIVVPSGMPYRPASLSLLGNGEMRYGRGKRFPEWAECEIERVAAVLLSEHAAYIELVLSGLKYEASEFAPLPADFLIKDDRGACRLGPAPPRIPIDLSRCDRVQLKLRWDQVVGIDYQRNRYMQRLSETDLERRLVDIVSNAHGVNDIRQISLDPKSADTFYWLARLKEVSVEMALRGAPTPAGWNPLDASRFPGSLDPERLRQSSPLIRPANLSSDYLVKYGKISHMKDALNGRLFISPASSYSDSSLNQAQRDNELIAEIDWNPDLLGLWDIWGSAGHLSQPRQAVRHESNSNYFVYCTAAVLSTRLLLDFEAEAALLIRDRDEFVNRVDRAFRATHSGWKTSACPVRYYDPIQVHPEEIQVVTWKHFRFAYQKEVRIAWTPPAVLQRLDPFFLEVGSLDDIAEIIIPAEHANGGPGGPA